MKLEDILKVCDCKKQIIDTDKNLISENAEYKNVYEFLNCEVVDMRQKRQFPHDLATLVPPQQAVNH